MNTELILGILSLIGTVIVGLFQFRSWKAQGKEAESRAEATLGDIALKINKQEVDTLRQLNEDLRKENETLKLEIKELKNKVITLEQIVEQLEDKIEKKK